MYKGINEITNKGLEFKLINSTSFGESMFSAGFIQKTIKGDLFVKRDYGIPPQKIVWKDSRRHQKMHHRSLGQTATKVGRLAQALGRPACFGVRLPSAVSYTFLRSTQRFKVVLSQCIQWWSRGVDADR
jgi:hypothetical protein